MTHLLLTSVVWSILVVFALSLSLNDGEVFFKVSIQLRSIQLLVLSQSCLS